MRKFINVDEIEKHAIVKDSVTYVPLQDILAMEPADVVPRKHGHWYLDPDGMDWGIPAWKCSECRCNNNNIPPYILYQNGTKCEVENPLAYAGTSFCGNCGADMRNS